MTFLFDHERKAFADHGPADAFVFQSDFQRKQLEPQLAPLGYDRRRSERHRHDGDEPSPWQEIAIRLMEDQG